MYELQISNNAVLLLNSFLKTLFYMLCIQNYFLYRQIVITFQSIIDQKFGSPINFIYGSCPH